MSEEMNMNQKYWDAVADREIQAAYSAGLDDEPIPLRDGDDELILNRLIDKQEDMAKVMSHIQDIVGPRNVALQAYLGHKFRFDNLMRVLNKVQAAYEAKTPADKSKESRKYFTWRRRLWDRANPERSARDKAWSKYELEKDMVSNHDQLSEYWEQWMAMRDEAGMIVADKTYLWPQYFKLAEEVFDPRHLMSDPEGIDDSIKPLDRAAPMYHEVSPGLAVRVQGQACDVEQLDCLEHTSQLEDGECDRDSALVTGDLYKVKSWMWNNRQDARIRGIEYDGEGRELGIMDEIDALILDSSV